MEEHDRQNYSVVEEYPSPWLKFHLGLPASSSSSPKLTARSRPPERQTKHSKHHHHQQQQHLHRSIQLFQPEKTLERSRDRHQHQHQQHQLSLRLNTAGKIKPTVDAFPHPCADYWTKAGLRRQATHRRSGKSSHSSSNNGVLITVDPYKMSSYRAQSIGTNAVGRINSERGQDTGDRGRNGFRSWSAGFGSDEGDDGSVRRNRKRAMELATTTPIRLLGMTRSMENNRELNWRSGKENHSRHGSVQLPLLTGTRTKEAMRAYGIPNDVPFFDRKDERTSSSLFNHDHAVRFDGGGRAEDMVYPDFWRTFSSESLPRSWKYSNSVVQPTMTIGADGFSRSSSNTWAGFEPQHDILAPIDEKENSTDDVDHSITVSIFKRKDFSASPEPESVRANRCDVPSSKTPAATAEEFAEDNEDYIDKSARDSSSDSDKEYAVDDGDNNDELMTIVESEFPLPLQNETATSGPRGNFDDGLHLEDGEDDDALSEIDEGFDPMDENKEAEKTISIALERSLCPQSETTVNSVELSKRPGRLFVVQGRRDVEIREEQTIERGGEIGVDFNNNTFDGIIDYKGERREDAIDKLDSIRRYESSEAKRNASDQVNDSQMSQMSKTVESESPEACVHTEHDNETASEFLRKNVEPTGNSGTSRAPENSIEHVNGLESRLSHLDSCAENVENYEDTTFNECGGTAVEVAESCGEEDLRVECSAGRNPCSRFSALEIIPTHRENGNSADGDSHQSELGLPVSSELFQHVSNADRAAITNESHTRENNDDDAGQTSTNSDHLSAASSNEKDSEKGPDKITDAEGEGEAGGRAENDSSPVKTQRKRSVRFSVATVYRYEALSPRDGGEITDHEDIDEDEPWA